MRRLRSDRRAGVGVTIAAALPMLIGAGALAVDLGSIQLETRRLQGVADAAALAAAVDPASAQTRAAASVADAGFPHDVTTAATVGTYTRDAAVAVANRFTAGAASPDAVKVVLTSRSPIFLARIFGFRDVEISRTATAQRQRLAALSIGSRLASVNGGLVNAYLAALTGSSLSVNVMDYNSLAGVDVDLLSFLPSLRTRVGAETLTFNDVLATNVTAPQALGALADTLAASGQPGLAATVRTIGGSVSGSQSFRLGTLIDLGVLGKQASGGTGVVKVSALSLLTTLLQLASSQRQVTIDTGVTVDKVAASKLTVAVGQRANQSPWISVGDMGQVTVRTAQTRAYLDVKLTPTAILGFTGLVDVRVPIFVELASAEARLTSVACPSATARTVGVEARTNPGTAALGAVDTTQLGDFSKAVATAPATIIDTLLIDAIAHTTANLGAVEPWQTLGFSADMIAGGTSQTVKSSTLVGGVAASLLSHPNLTIYVAGLPVPLSPLLAPVGTLLSGVAAPVDQLLTLVTGSLGIGIGEADVRVTGARCGMAVLVA